jgi:hypothetical protein
LFSDWRIEKDANLIESEYRRRIFQSLAEHNYEKNPFESKRRGTAEDKDLLDAFKCLKRFDSWECPNPCFAIRAPPQPPAISLPSSESTDFAGTVTLGVIEELVETLLILKIRGIDIRFNYSSADVPNLRKAVNSTIAALSLKGRTDVNWSDFNNLFERLFVRCKPFTV